MRQDQRGLGLHKEVDPAQEWQGEDVTTQGWGSVGRTQRPECRRRARKRAEHPLKGKFTVSAQGWHPEEHVQSRFSSLGD